MNFKSFLKTQDPEEILEKCKPFIKQSGGLPMFRGYTSSNGGGGTIDIRKDRKPRDSSQVTHDLLDQYFLKKVGAKIRSEGMFVTGDIKAAKYYGHPYFVFPVGEFKFVWGTYNGDPVRDTFFATQNITDLMAVNTKDKIPGIVDKVMDQVHWQTTNLEEAIKSKAEIVVLCDQAIIVRYSPSVSYQKLIGG